MALPNPLPDNPLKWDGWKNYNSANLYDRLCLDFTSNAANETIEEHCRQLLVWWQKKLPLKNQPSNPMAQMLRQGLDEAPHFLAEARTKLLDTEERKRIDTALHSEVLGRAIGEFKKLLGFTLADKRLSKESEEKLYIAGERLGLSRKDMEPVINEELTNTGAQRVVEDQKSPAASGRQAQRHSGAGAPGPRNGGSPGGGGTAADEFRRFLRMSRLCLDGEEMSDDQRDAMCNVGESLGLSGGDAEDLIDEYLEEMASLPSEVPVKPVAVAPVRSIRPQQPQPPRGAAKTVTQTPATPQPAPGAAVVKKEAAKPGNLSPAALALERQKHPNFVNPAGIEMVLVPSGRFMMGSTDPASQMNEQPVTPVTLTCFYMSRFPVTNAQFEMFDPGHATKRAPWADHRHPVIYVSWNDAEAFCKWLSTRERKVYRLPTEAEWEYAARGTDGRMFPWGTSSAVGQFANFADLRTTFPWRDPSVDDGFAETSPVGAYPRGASPFGVEDMSGNIFEWCIDFYDKYKGKEVANPRVVKGGNHRVYRGGSWKSRITSLRAAARAFNEPGYLSSDVGFRIVCECA